MLSYETGAIIRPMRHCVAIVFFLALQGTAYSQSAPILRIYGVVTQSGTEQKYESILRTTAAACRRVGCPQSYLVFQSLSNPGETWLLSTFASREEAEKFDDYLRNSDLPINRKRMPVRISYGYWVAYRPDLGDGSQWNMGKDQVLIVTRTKAPTEGAVFQGANEFIAIRPALSDADAVAAAAKADVFLKCDVFVAVLRPELSFPAKEWIDANPELWARRPSTGDIRQVIDDRTPQ